MTFGEFGVRLFGTYGYTPEEFTPEGWPSLWEIYMRDHSTEEAQLPEDAGSEGLDVDVRPLIDHVEPLLLHLRNELDRITRHHQIHGKAHKMLRFRITADGLVQGLVAEPTGDPDALQVTYSLKSEIQMIDEVADRRK